ncbi:MAG: O-antigen ligase family protein [Calditrichaceae bacterium]
MTKFTKISLGFIIFALPLQIISIYVGFSIILVRVLFLSSFFVAVFLMLIRGELNIPKTYIDLNILLLIIANFIITLFAIDVLLSLKDALLQMYIIFFFYYIYWLMNTEKSLEFAVNAYIYTAIILSLYGAFQQIGFLLGWDTRIPFLDYFSYNEALKDPASKDWAMEEISSFFIRIRGTFFDTNTFAGYIVSAFGLAITKLIYSYKERKAGSKFKYWLIIFIFLITILLTMSRSALVGLFLLFMVILFYYHKELFGRFLWLRIIVPFVVVAIFGILLIPDLLDLIIGVVTSFSMDNKNPLRTKSTMLHLKIALQGIEMFIENPITGVGLNNFRISYAHSNHLWYTGFTNKNMMAHSVFLSFFSEGGIIGAIANYSIIGTIILKSHSRIKSILSSYKKSQMVGIFAAYIGILGSNIFYQYYLNEFVWFLIAANVAAFYVLKPDD